MNIYTCELLLFCQLIFGILAQNSLSKSVSDNPVDEDRNKLDPTCIAGNFGSDLLDDAFSVAIVPIAFKNTQ
jgi:hypothetical protein